MPFSLSDYALLRPYLYHLTARDNLASIRKDLKLKSADTLLRAANLKAKVRVRRKVAETITVDGRQIMLRDQRPLSENSIAFVGGFTFPEFVEFLNQRVFFWAGNDLGPAGGAKTYGLNHFKTYKDERPAILRINFESLIQANPGHMPLFCQYNSGAPRCSSGHKATGCRVPRGPDTFLPALQFGRGAAAVAEVTFAGHVNLPANVEVASQFEGPWRRL